jgi:hypothetical protein
MFGFTLDVERIGVSHEVVRCPGWSVTIIMSMSLLLSSPPLSHFRCMRGLTLNHWSFGSRYNLFHQLGSLGRIDLGLTTDGNGQIFWEGELNLSAEA